MKSNQIRKQVRKLLLEKKDGDYSFGCIMVNVNIPKKEWDKIQSLIEDDEIYEEGNTGREDEPHATILYGLHATNSDDKVKDVVSEFDPFDMELKKVDIFDTNPDFDVIKFSITSKDLVKYNKILKDLPYTNDYPDYKPHVTIAYVKSGKGKEIMKRYKDFKALEFHCDKIRYSKADKSNKFYTLKK